jgi:hypothetical protein
MLRILCDAANPTATLRISIKCVSLQIIDNCCGNVKASLNRIREYILVANEYI